MFYAINFQGRDGATFFFSCRSFRDWRTSLEFYRGVGRRAKLKKLLCLFAYPWVKFRADRDIDSIRREISEVLHVPPPEILSDAPFSALISMTGDKAVIHFHGRGYLKIASGDSLPEVAGELAIYRLLAEKNPRSFDFSRCGQSADAPEYVSFFMEYAPGRHYANRHPEISTLLDVLHEFFSLTPPRERPWSELWSELDVRALTDLLPEDFKVGSTPVGLVHRDFKPWNVKAGDKPLIYDFESASRDGCPLEDFFNYLVDPWLRLVSPAEVHRRIGGRYWRMAEDHLVRMGLPPSENRRYWCWYLAERVVFWRRHKQPAFAENFVELLKLSCR